MNFLDLQTEVARRATKNEGSQFATAIKNAINAALLRVSREAYWRVLRRAATLSTITSYTTGSGAGTFTNGSTAVTVVGATFITDDVQVGRLITLEGSNKLFKIAQITGETTLVLDQNYDGTSIAGTGTYEILPQEEYNLPLQVTHRFFLWHEDYGYPYKLNYITDQDFFGLGIDRATTGTPTHYRLWGTDSVIEQIKTPSVVSVVSSSSSDTAKSITVYGTVSGYPDRETITLTGTTAALSTKTFSNVERIVKKDSIVGRVTVTANSGNTTVAVLPVGETNDNVMYRKVQLYPLPDSVFPINVYYYKDVYKLENDEDVHELGQEFDEAIILLASAKLQVESGQQEGANFFQLYQDEIKSLKGTNVDKFDWALFLRRAGAKRNDPLIHPNLSYRQLGGDYGPTVS